jgi:hypothetical protein
MVELALLRGMYVGIQSRALRAIRWREQAATLVDHPRCWRMAGAKVH